MHIRQDVALYTGQDYMSYWTDLYEGFHEGFYQVADLGPFEECEVRAQRGCVGGHTRLHPRMHLTCI